MKLFRYFKVSFGFFRMGVLFRSFVEEKEGRVWFFRVLLFRVCDFKVLRFICVGILVVFRNWNGSD